MKTSKHIATRTAEEVIKQAIADKRTIREHLANGGKWSELESKGIRFAQPVPFRK